MANFWQCLQANQNALGLPEQGGVDEGQGKFELTSRMYGMDKEFTSSVEMDRWDGVEVTNSLQGSGSLEGCLEERICRGGSLEEYMEFRGAGVE